MIILGKFIKIIIQIISKNAAKFHDTWIDLTPKAIGFSGFSTGYYLFLFRWLCLMWLSFGLEFTNNYHYFGFFLTFGLIQTSFNIMFTNCMFYSAFRLF